MQTRCPICGNPLPVLATGPRANPNHPFCSARCKMIDLDRWLSGDYRIPGDPVDPDANPEGDGDRPPVATSRDHEA